MAITYSISGGADAAKFNIDGSTGVVTFKAAPNFEAPGDANADNVYEVQVKATDSGGAATTQDVRVTVTDVSENAPPQITSAAAVTVAENQTTVLTVTAIDPDPGGGTTPPVEPPTSTVGLITDFTTTPKAQIKIDGHPYSVQTAGYAHSLTNPDPYTLRLEIRPGDHAWFDGSNVDRSQLSRGGDVAYGTPFNVSFLFNPVANGPNNTFVNNASWMNLGLIHDNGPSTNTGSAPVWVGFTGNKLNVGINYRSSSGNSTPGGQTLWTDTKSVVVGQYTEIRIESNNLNTSSGYVRVWVGGVRVVNYTGPLGYGNSTYWIPGIYRDAGPSETVAVLIRNMGVT